MIDRLPASARVKQPAADRHTRKRAQFGVFDGALEERIAAAFGKTNSSDVAILIAEAETALVACSEAAEMARSQRLILPSVLPTWSRPDAQIEDAVFRRDRPPAERPILPRLAFAPTRSEGMSGRGLY